MEEVKESGFELGKSLEALKSSLKQESEPVGFEPALS